MDRRRLLLVSLASIPAQSLTVRAQPARNVPRIGFLGNSNPTHLGPSVAAFRHGLRELGWIEDENVTIVFRWADGDLERHPALVSELVRLPVDVLLVAGTVATRAALGVTTSIPIVVAITSDPVSQGFAASLARPGRNMTGLANQFEDVVGKQLQILKEAVPWAMRVAILWHSLQPSFRQVTEVAARGLGLTVRLMEVRREADFEGVLRAAKNDADAMHVLPSPALNRHRERLAHLALKHRRPTIYEVKEFVEAGGLMSYGPSFPDMYRRAASYVDRILKGAKAGDLPIEQAAKFELVINLKTAKALGLTIPPSLLLRADHVIE